MQFWHWFVVEATAPEYVPAGQFVQAPLPGPMAKLPAAQATHTDEFIAPTMADA